jgi:hypothetical protein
MRTVLLLVVMAIMASASEPANYSGFGDTATIVNFRADSLKRSRAFQWSSWEQKDIAILFNDTATAGFIGDSVAFYYWIEVGRPIAKRGGTLDTVWRACMVIDTIKMTAANAADSARFTISIPQMQVDGSYYERFGYIDTVNVSSWAYNSHNVVGDWGTLMRVGFKGITGNRTGGGFVPVVVSVGQRAYMPVRAR